MAFGAVTRGHDIPRPKVRTEEKGKGAKANSSSLKKTKK